MPCRGQRLHVSIWFRGERGVVGLRVSQHRNQAEERKCRVRDNLGRPISATATEAWKRLHPIVITTRPPVSTTR